MCRDDAIEKDFLRRATKQRGRMTSTSIEVHSECVSPTSRGGRIRGLTDIPLSNSFAASGIDMTGTLHRALLNKYALGSALALVVAPLAAMSEAEAACVTAA